MSNLLEGEKFLDIIDGKVKGDKKSAEIELSNLLDRIGIDSISEYRTRLKESKPEALVEPVTPSKVKKEVSLKGEVAPKKKVVPKKLVAEKVVEMLPEEKMDIINKELKTYVEKKKKGEKLTETEKKRINKLRNARRNTQKDIDFNKKKVEERKAIVSRKGKVKWEIEQIENIIKEHDWLGKAEIKVYQEKIGTFNKELKLLERELNKIDGPKKTKKKGEIVELSAFTVPEGVAVQAFVNYVKRKLKNIQKGKIELGTIYSEYFNLQAKKDAVYGLMNKVTGNIFVAEFMSLPRKLRMTMDSSQYLDLRYKLSLGPVIVSLGGNVMGHPIYGHPAYNDYENPWWELAYEYGYTDYLVPLHD